jgi:trehalose 6-phosphate synthase
MVRDAAPPGQDAATADAARRLLGDRRLLVAANRAPVAISPPEDGGPLRTRRAPGGLVTALRQALRGLPVTWIAAAVSEGDRRAAADPDLVHRALADELPEVEVRLIATRRAVYEAAYGIIANPLLWFLQHQLWNLPETPMIDARTMRAWNGGYVALNRAFGEAVIGAAGDDPEPRVMLHDYHLYLAARTIRSHRPRALLSHFTHIPWPPPSAWQVIPSQLRTEICRGLCANDLVGFQAARYAHNFLRTVESFLPDADVDHDRSAVVLAGRRVAVRTYPISIDVAETRRIAASAPARRRQAELAATSPGLHVVRVDRLEPSKNIVRGFAAFEALLARHAELRGRVTFLAFLVPSRTRLPEYADYGRKVQAAVDRINGRYGASDYQPVRIFYENDYPQALAGLAIADAVLVNPLSDGMNLVVKEAAAVAERDAAIVLSETAGAHDQMAEGVLSIAPADVVGTADALAEALAMPRAERAGRLAVLRERLEREDLAWWMRSQIEDLATLAQPRRTLVGVR